MARYCTQCYTPAKGDESFCRNCGHPMKVKEGFQGEKSLEEKETFVMTNPEQKESFQGETIKSDQVITETKEKMAEIVTFGEWVWSTLLCFIPLVNIIMLIIWAATSETNPNKQNFARAMLIWTIVGVVFSIILFTMMVSLIVIGPGTGRGGGYGGYGFTF